MSELDLQETGAAVDQMPTAVSLGQSPTEGFWASYKAAERSAGDWSAYGNMADALQDHLDHVKSATGQEFDNPLLGFTRDPHGMERLSHLQDALGELASKRSDPSIAMPGTDDLYNRGLAKARAASRYAEEVEAGPHPFGFTAAKFLGGMAGAAAGDPAAMIGSNALTLALLPAPGGPFAASVLRSAAALAAGQLADSLQGMHYRQLIQPDYGFGDVAKEVAAAAAFGAGGELAGAGLAAAWRHLRGVAPSVARAVSQPLQDAGNVAERAADIDANNPFRTGVSGAIAHRESVSQIEMQLANGEAPAPPAVAAAEAKTPTGQVFIGNRPVDVKYELAEAGDLVTSHGKDFEVNPAYPAELQPRNRANVASRAQVYDMASNLEPARLGPSPEANFGAPLVGPDNIVESGNARVMAIRRAYEGEPDDPLRASLRAMLDENASVTAIGEHPLVKQAQAESASKPETKDLPGYGTAEFEARREFNLNGQPITGYHNYVKALNAKAESYSTAGPVEQGRHATIVIGLPASGKSTISEGLARESRAAVVDSDDAKRGIPGFDGGVGSTAVHEESSELFKRVLVDQTDKGNNLVIPLAGANVSSLRDRLVLLRQAGYSIDLVHLSAAPAAAYRRSLRRFLQTGRFVSRDYFEKVDGNPKKTYDILKGDQNVQAAAEITDRGRLTEGADTALGSRLGRSSYRPGDGRGAAGRGLEIPTQAQESGGRSGAYRSFLERSGFDTSQYRQPILIGRRLTKMSPGERADLAHAANASVSLRMGTTEQAISDARHIDSGITDLLQGGPLDSAANRDFRRAFVARLPSGEASGMLTKDGDLAAAGMQRLKAAAVARAYGDPGVLSRAFEHPEPNIKTIAGALTDAAPEWIKLKGSVARGEVPSANDISSDLMTVVKSIMKARDTGRPVHEIINQGDMFHSDVSSMAARMFFKDGGFSRFLPRRDMADNLSTVARDVVTSAQRGKDLFGAEPIKAEEALAGRIRIGQREAVPDPAALAGAENQKAIADAALSDLRRNIEQGANRVPVTDENGNSALGFADKELEAAERQEMLAKEIAGCAG